MNSLTVVKHVQLMGLATILLLGANLHAEPTACNVHIALTEAGKTPPLPGKPQKHEDTLLTLRPSEPLRMTTFIRNLQEKEVNVEIDFEGNGVVLSPSSPLKLSLAKNEIKEISVTARVPAGGHCRQGESLIRVRAFSAEPLRQDCGKIEKHLVCPRS